MENDARLEEKKMGYVSSSSPSEKGSLNSLEHQNRADRDYCRRICGVCLHPNSCLLFLSWWAKAEMRMFLVRLDRPGWQVVESVAKRVRCRSCPASISIPCGIGSVQVSSSSAPQPAIIPVKIIQVIAATEALFATRTISSALHIKW